ncbi:hypothetical protein GWI33_004217 [Rhynchophorus ferrugineus]|uniref:Uncharacterized protein n=1 Tax=Rhynchophorus ferrugineus TaxID=354439 RepID=A0A834MGZ2_RHYFE|nr:hypothetical protein GWI33_004217 [Rhynchophorus ferrugineus]
MVEVDEGREAGDKSESFLLGRASWINKDTCTYSEFVGHLTRIVPPPNSIRRARVAEGGPRLSKEKNDLICERNGRAGPAKLD